MPRIRKILFVLATGVLFCWMGGPVPNSSAHPSDHSHKHMVASLKGHQHNAESSAGSKFYCPMHKHRSLMPCPHKHSRKEMADPKQCAIGPDCNGSPVKSLPVNTGFDYHQALMEGRWNMGFPDNVSALSSLPVAYDDPPLNSPKHPPKSLQ